MAGKSAILTLKILGDAKDAQKSLDEVSSSAGKFQGGVEKAALPAAAALAGLGAAGKVAVDAASAVEQAYGGIEAVFGSSADQVKGFADAASDSVGLAKSEYAELATVIGSQLKNAGTPMDELGDKTDDLIRTGADLAATFGGSTSDAVSALSSALKGEMDPIEAYGITLNQAAIDAEMAAQGTDKLTGAQEAAAKQQAILSLIAKQGTDSQGQYAAQMNTVAQQQQRATAEMENAKAAIGQALLPAVQKLASTFADVAKWVGENSRVFLILGTVVGGLAATILILNVAFKAYAVVSKAVSAATKAWTAVQWLLNASFWANPIFLIIAGVLALIAAIVVIAKKTDWFQKIWDAAWKAIKTAAKAVWDWLKTASLAAITFVAGLWKKISAAAKVVWDAIKTIVSNVLKVIKTVVTTYINIYINIWRTIKAAVKAVWDWILGIIRDILGRIKDSVRNAMDGVVNIFEGIKSAVNAVWTSIKNAATTAMNAILTPVNAVKNAFNNVVSAIQSVISWLGRIRMPKALSDIGNTIGNITPWSATPPTSTGTVTAAPTAGLFAAPHSTAGSSGNSGVNITINGALDPVAVARQIRLILRSDEQRRGGVNLR